MLANSMKLPASPEDALRQVIDPGLSLLLPSSMHSGQARQMVLAIFMQESGLRNRTQMGGGPAHGLGQFEEGGACKGVLNHPATRATAAEVCSMRGIVATAHAVWTELVQDDLLAVAFARLLLYTDSAPLPVMGDVDGSWSYYKRNWRPGKPRPNDWPDNYARAMRAIEGAT